MTLKIRRGLESDRLSITPVEGELIYTTDEKIVYIGDGNTAGGERVTGILPERSEVSATTASLTNGTAGNIIITGFKGYILYKIETSAAAWVRLYTDQTSRTNDASRIEGVDPASDSGVIAEVITTGNQTVLIAPATIGFNNESTPTTNIPVAVTNKSGSTQTITVTLTILQIEI